MSRHPKVVPFCTFLLLLLLPGLGTEPAHAQVRLIPMVGLYAPLSDLGEVQDATGATLIEAGKRSSTLAYGGGVELGGKDALANLRLDVLYGSSADVPILESVGCGDCELRNTLLAANLTFMIRPFPGVLVVQPYLLAGGGIKRHAFDWQELQDEGFEDFFRDQTRPSLLVGAGTEVVLGWFRPRLELTAHLSRFEAAEGEPDVVGSDARQTDLFFVFSLPLGR